MINVGNLIVQRGAMQCAALAALVIGLSLISSCAGARSSTEQAVTSIPPPDATVMAKAGEVNVVGDATETSVPRFNLGKVGDRVELQDGQRLVLTYDGYDPTSQLIVSEYDDSSKRLMLAVADRASHVVRFTKKCQVFRVGNTSVLPAVAIASGLQREQVIVTPLCDSDGHLVGYEYRYGSAGKGCNEQAKDGLAAFRRCGGQPRPQPNPDPCPECIYFGSCKRHK